MKLTVSRVNQLPIRMFNIKNYILATQFICVLRTILNKNNNYFAVRNKLAGHSKGKTLCSARDIFTYNVDEF
jgi:hypothetical protein